MSLAERQLLEISVPDMVAGLRGRNGAGEFQLEQEVQVTLTLKTMGRQTLNLVGFNGADLIFSKMNVHEAGWLRTNCGTVLIDSSDIERLLYNGSE